MELNYTLQEEDYIVFNLYHTSKNLQIKKQRIRSWVVIAVCFVVITYFAHQNMNIELLNIVPIFVIFLILYPFALRSSQRKSITRAVEANYGDAYSKEAFVIIGNNYIETSDKRGLTRANIPYINGLVEIGDYFFIKLTGLNYIIIPKRHYEDVDFIRKKMMDISNQHNLPFDIELDWKWK